MSRTILLVCLLVGCALSLPLLSVSKIQQRLSALDAADTCDKSASYTCLGAGATCVSTSDCDRCGDKFTNCIANGTSACECFTGYVNCAAALKNNIYCPSLVLFDTCNSTFSGECACGTPYPKNEGSVCRMGYTCSNTSNTCVKLGGLGASCNENADCYADINRAIECRDNVCHYRKYSGFASDACSEDEDCGGYAYDESSCVNGKCTGVAIGGNCTVTASCVSGSFCNATTYHCQAVKSEGQFCGNEEGACAVPLICNENCIKIASVPAGGKCESSSHCNFGLMCKNGICGSQVYPKNCTSSTQCSVSSGYDGSCSCNSDVGSDQCTPDNWAFPSSCQGSLDSYVSCVTTSGCNANGPCDACYTTGNCFTLCVQKEYFQSSGLDANCLSFSCESPSSTTSADSAAGVISASIAVVIAAAILVIA